MTTLVRTRNPLENLSMNNQPPRRRSDRIKASNTEQDGDFTFARGGKRAKPAPSPPPPDFIPAPIPARNKRKAQNDEEPQTEAKKSSRRKMSFSTPKQEDNAIRVAKRATRKSSRGSIEKSETASTPMIEEVELDSIDIVGAPSIAEGSILAMDTSKESTKIALPFSDTPVINRNKELRRKTGARRSSLGLRGRRASSLIDNGQSALPHQQVGSENFYKHIEADGLSEPRRMKQLLMWCGERALGERPSHNGADNSAVLAARAIQEAILKDFSTRSDMSDWFNRQDSGRTVIVKVPNPLNIQVATNIRELEEKVQRLKAEKEQWNTLTRTMPSLPPLVDPAESTLSPSAIDTSILDLEDVEMVEFLKTNSSAQLVSNSMETLRRFQEGLEFQVDQFADGVHKIEQSRQTMERVANKVLALSAVRLEERERDEKEAVGTRDLPIQEVLRSLSRIMPTGSSGSSK